MTKHVIDAFMVGGIPVVSVAFEKGVQATVIIDAAYKVIEELCGPSISLPVCAMGHPQHRFRNGATACTLFEEENGLPVLRIMFKAAPPADCALMLLLKTPTDKKGMN